MTGGTGSFGKTFIKFLTQTQEFSKIIVFSRDELKQWEMQQEIKDDRVRYFLGDIRDKERLERAFHDVDVVVHAAALKQVPALEYNPIEAIKTNILGTQNIINASIDQKVSKVLMLSTDKAVNPANLYGATKLCAEKLMVASNAYSKKTYMMTGEENRPMFSVVRYGNVMSSRGSVIPLFKEQAKTGKLTVTHKDMTRFWVSLDDAVKFVYNCLNRMQGGEIFIPKLPTKKIVDLAKEICPECALDVIGIRPGEKIHEVLISKDEARHAVEYDDSFVIDNSVESNLVEEYTSAD